MRLGVASCRLNLSGGFLRSFRMKVCDNDRMASGREIKTKAAAQAASEPPPPALAPGEVDLSNVEIPIDLAVVDPDAAAKRKPVRPRKAPVKAE